MATLSLFCPFLSMRPMRCSTRIGFREIVIHHAIAKLVVETFAANFGKQQQVKAVFILSLLFKAGSKRCSILIRSPPMDQPDTEPIFAKMVEKIAQRMSEAAEQHYFVVR